MNNEIELDEGKKLSKKTKSERARIRLFNKEFQKLKRNIAQRMMDFLESLEKHELDKLQKTTHHILTAKQEQIEEGREKFMEQEFYRKQEELKEYAERDSWRLRLQPAMIPEKPRSAQPEQFFDFPRDDDDERDFLSFLRGRSRPGKKGVKTHRLILIMKVDLGDGREDTIRVHEDDSFELLARVFQRKHKLSPQIVQPLAEQIRAQVEATIDNYL